MSELVPNTTGKKPAAKQPVATATSVPLKLGDLVKIRYHAGVRGRIVELRGPLGPGGAQIYRVLVRRRPSPAYVEMREDQLEAVPAGTK